MPADIRAAVDTAALQPGGATAQLLGLLDGRRIGDWVTPQPVGAEHAVGFMQFLPSTWRTEAAAAPGAPRDPYRPLDAMTVAGSYLRRIELGAAGGGQHDLRGALAVYGGSIAYAEQVLALAGPAIITDLPVVLPIPAPGWVQRIATPAYLAAHMAPPAVTNQCVARALATWALMHVGDPRWNHPPARFGNAIDLYGVARAQGFAVSSLPAPGEMVVYGSSYGVFGHIATVVAVEPGRYEVIEQNFLDFSPNLEGHWATFDLRSAAGPDAAVEGFVVGSGWGEGGISSLLWALSVCPARADRAAPGPTIHVLTPVPGTCLTVLVHSSVPDVRLLKSDERLRRGSTRCARHYVEAQLGMNAKVLVYPICLLGSAALGALVNWSFSRQVLDSATPPPRRGGSSPDQPELCDVLAELRILVSDIRARDAARPTSDSASIPKPVDWNVSLAVAGEHLTSEGRSEWLFYGYDIVTAMLPVALAVALLALGTANPAAVLRIFRRGDLLVAGMAVAFVTASAISRRSQEMRSLSVVLTTILMILGLLQGSLYGETVLADAVPVPNLHDDRLAVVSICLLAATIVVGSFNLPWPFRTVITTARYRRPQRSP